jgi:transposase-like protein
MAMARNKVQFQKGLSDAAFAAQYGTEEQCRAALFASRWPDGFACPACGGKEHCVLKKGAYQCNACRTQTTLTSGTIFASTKLPLTQWFRALYHMTQTKQGISSLELARRLGVQQNTAWLMKQKLAQVMLEREGKKPLDGRVEMDDAYLGGERHDGKRGRGSPGKMAFVAAVETTDSGKPVRIKLRRVKRFTKANIKKLTEKHIKKTARVVTDGLGCFRGVAAAGATHAPLIVSQLGHSEKLPQFKWVNTILGNIKSAITGTYRAARKHADRTLAEFEYRFNRRFDLTTIVPRLAYAAVRTQPFPRRFAELADDAT